MTISQHLSGHKFLSCSLHLHLVFLTSSNIMVPAKKRFDTTILQRTHGSGPMGESTNRAKFHVLRTCPAELDLLSESRDGPATTSGVFPPPTKRDLPIDDGRIKDHAFFIDNILSPEECAAVIALSEHMGYSPFAPAITTPPGMRRNTAAHWFAGPDSARKFLRPLFARFRHLLPKNIGGAALFPELTHRVAHYRYKEVGEEFTMHTDGQWPGQGVYVESGEKIVRGEIEDWGPRGPGWDGDGRYEYEGGPAETPMSKFSMLLYLNDDSGNSGRGPRGDHADAAVDGSLLPNMTGGATLLFGSAGAQRLRAPKPQHRVFPKVGGALFFRHGFGPESVLHAGEPLESGVKYVVRMQVLYGGAAGPEGGGVSGGLGQAQGRGRGEELSRSGKGNIDDLDVDEWDHEEDL